MRKRRKQIEIIGTSFLDVMSCGFIALFILYLKSPQTDGSIISQSTNFELIDVVVQDGDPYFVGFSFELESQKIYCWPPFECKSSGNVSWSAQEGQSTAFIQKGTIGNEMVIAITKFPKDKNPLPPDVCIQIKTLKSTVEVKLERDKLYRAHIDMEVPHTC